MTDGFLSPVRGFAVWEQPFRRTSCATFPNFQLSTFNFSFSIFFSIAILEHIAQYLDGESGFFNFEILAEMAKL